MPKFARYSELDNNWRLIEYDDSKPGLELRTEKVSRDVAQGAPKDGVAGDQYLEKVLGRLLLGEWSSTIQWSFGSSN